MGRQFGAPLSLFLYFWPVYLGSLIMTVWLFGLNFSNGPFPVHLLRDPLCQGLAGVTLSGSMPALLPGPRSLGPLDAVTSL